MIFNVNRDLHIICKQKILEFLKNGKIPFQECSELERANRMSLECQDDFSDVNITQLNNIRRCFVLQKREFDRVYDKTNDQ